jgi:DNA-binding LacI/PurR family transcriptional regulator
MEALHHEREPVAGKVRIYDVAREAGVALGTVSRVLNDSPSVSPQLRERVNAAIDRLGYRPSSIARSLVSGTARSLAMLVPELNNRCSATWRSAHKTPPTSWTTSS